MLGRHSFSLWPAAGLAGLLSLWAAVAVYRAVDTASDEYSYLFQAHCLYEGKIRRPYPQPSAGARRYLPRASLHYRRMRTGHTPWNFRRPGFITAEAAW
jgi:hypothetical protein